MTSGEGWSPDFKTYWERYYDRETVVQDKGIRQELFIRSTGVLIHLDLYEQPDRNRPVIIVNHGGGGYSRFFVTLADHLYRQGYSVVLPNQRGQGFSEGNRGDFTMGQLVENIIDVTSWARMRYGGNLFLMGLSLGGGLVYNAASATKPVTAVICHNLYDFGNGADSLALSRMPKVGDSPSVARVMAQVAKGGARVAPHLKIPFRMLGKFENMVDARDATFYEIWKHDPVPLKAVSLRYVASTFNTPPAVPFEDNSLPILVINPLRDTMVDPAVTQRNFMRLNGPKTYREIDFGHWATGAAFMSEYGSVLDEYMQSFIQKG
jgi:alpha-beta hydrolase superfamily lysophospholipase